MNIKKINTGVAAHVALFVIIAGLMGVNATLLYRADRKVQNEKRAIEEAAKPAELEITVLSVPSCPECVDMNDLLTPLKNTDKVQIRKEETVEYTSDKGAELVKKYGVIRVPTLLVTGDTTKLFDVASFVQNLGTQAEDGTLVITNVPAPYVDVASGAVKGKFTATYITDKACKDCYDPVLHRRALAGLAMKPAEEKFSDRADAEGRRLISRYSITSVPTVILTGDLGEYPRFAQVWPTVGTVAKDGTHVFSQGQELMGVYHDLKTGKVVKPKVPDPAAPPASTDH